MRGFQRWSNRGDRGNRYNFSQLICQVCGKLSCIALTCYYWFDHNYQSQNSQIFILITSLEILVDLAWYIDNEAKNHVTDELGCVQASTKYLGNKKLTIDNGQGLAIKHIGHFFLSTSDKTILLKNILHVPSIIKNLLSISKIVCNNDVVGIEPLKTKIMLESYT